MADCLNKSASVAISYLIVVLYLKIAMLLQPTIKFYNAHFNYKGLINTRRSKLRSREKRLIAGVQLSCITQQRMLVMGLHNIGT